MSMAFSADNRQIIFANKGSGQGNTLAKYTIIDKGYSDGVSCVRFSLNTANPIIVSCRWDKYDII